MSQMNAAKAMLNLAHEPRFKSVVLVKRKCTAWSLFIQDPGVKKHIMSRRRHPATLVLRHYTQVAQHLWERVKQNKALLEHFQARADHINNCRRCAVKPPRLPKMLVRPGPDDTQIVEWDGPPDPKRPARMIYDKHGKILKVFMYSALTKPRKSWSNQHTGPGKVPQTEEQQAASRDAASAKQRREREARRQKIEATRLKRKVQDQQDQEQRRKRQRKAYHAKFDAEALKNKQEFDEYADRKRNKQNALEDI